LREDSNWRLSRLKERFSVVCVLVLPVSRLLNLKTEIKKML